MRYVDLLYYANLQFVYNFYFINTEFKFTHFVALSRKEQMAGGKRLAHHLKMSNRGIDALYDDVTAHDVTCL